MALRSNRTADVEAGLLFTLFGAVTAALSLQYPLGTIAMMGPGMFPFLLGVILSVLGLAILAKGLVAESEQARSFPLRPAILIPVSLLIFALLIVWAGLLIAVPAQVFVALWASDHFTFKRAVVLSVGLLVFCYIVFVHFLGIAVPLIAV